MGKGERGKKGKRAIGIFQKKVIDPWQIGKRGKGNSVKSMEGKAVRMEYGKKCEWARPPS